MAWDFSTEPEFQKTLDWIRDFVDNTIIPLDLLCEGLDQRQLDALWAPLKEEVKKKGLWAPHLGPEHGGQGMGQVKLALIHEILGRHDIASEMFGCQGPDSGNAELLAVGANEAQRERWLYPLMRGEVRSTFSMTEPHTASSDPTEMTTRAVRDGDEWVIDGHKWFASNASVSDFTLLFAVTDPEAPPHQRASMFVVERGTPGMKVVRDVGSMSHPYFAEPGHLMDRVGGHSEVVFEGCRVPHGNLIGEPGQGFVLSQKRLGGGRIHHAMRCIGQAQRAYEMMCERAASRHTKGRPLGKMQMVQDMIAESYTEIEAARMLVLRAAWKMDQGDDHGTSARAEISMIKFYVPRLTTGIIDRAIQIHGALGYTTDMPLEGMYRSSRALRIADGADEIHKQAMARQLLKDVTPVPSWPSEHVPTRRAEAWKRFADRIEAVRKLA
ncbi:MAG TPA: acyl-CoA dehydrogenase family protein [Myxococcota bacterium]|nr:acyl-CoA dehydrogenase family protein [Myxococcota bacterium]